MFEDIPDIILYGYHLFMFIYLFTFAGGLYYFLHCHMQSRKLKGKMEGKEGGKERSYILLILLSILFLETYLKEKVMIGVL